MALQFKDYLRQDLDMEADTPGGDTYTLNGKAVCFRYTRSHRRAVWALTGGISTDIDDITDDAVDAMLAEGKLYINDDNCVAGHGWMGCVVWDEKEELIGTVGDRCSMAAGQQTEHPGYGRCKYHHGIIKNAARGMTNATASKTFKRLVQDKIDAYASDPAKMDLSRELGIQRTMLELLLDRLGSEDIDDADSELVVMIGNISTMADKVARLVDKISTVDHRTALTAGQILYVQSVIVDVMNKYVPRDKLQAAAQELSERLGTRQAFGSAVTNMLGSGDTVSMPTTRRVVARVIE